METAKTISFEIPAKKETRAVTGKIRSCLGIRPDFMTLLKRFTLIVDDGVVRHVFYPIFPPDRSATDVINWLSERPSKAINQYPKG
jgi:hypothetical protein